MKGIPEPLMALAQLGYLCALAPAVVAIVKPTLRDEELVWSGSIGLVFAIIAIIGHTQAKTWTRREAWVVFGATLGLLSALLFGLFGWQIAVVPLALVAIGALLLWAASRQTKYPPPDDHYLPPYYWW